MKNEIQVINGIEASLWNTMKNTLYPGASDESVLMVLDYCKAAKLDPMLQPVHIVPKWNGRLEKMIDVVMPGIGLYRIQAARTGQYAGKSKPKYGKAITEKIGNKNITYPNFCEITVYKLIDGQKYGFTAKEYWIENYASGKNGIGVNDIWSRRPRAQLAKCTEAQATRMAFPEAVTAQPTAEEMEGKTIDITPHQSAVIHTASKVITQEASPNLSSRPITLYNNWLEKEIDIMPEAVSIWLEGKLNLIHTKNEMAIMESFLLSNKAKLTAWAKLNKENKNAWMAFHSGLASKRVTFVEDDKFNEEEAAKQVASNMTEEPEVEIEMEGDSEYQEAIRC